MIQHESALRWGSSGSQFAVSLMVESEVLRLKSVSINLTEAVLNTGHWNESTLTGWKPYFAVVVLKNVFIFIVDSKFN